MNRRPTLTEIVGYVVVVAVTFAATVMLIEGLRTIFNVYFILTGD
jgi:hypothetical protein